MTDIMNLAAERMVLRRTLDAAYVTVRVRCDDGTLSYPLAYSHDDRPLSYTDCLAVVAKAIESGGAQSRIPDCPPKPVAP